LARTHSSTGAAAPGAGAPVSATGLHGTVRDAQARWCGQAARTGRQHAQRARRGRRRGADARARPQVRRGVRAQHLRRRGAVRVQRAGARRGPGGNSWTRSAPWRMAEVVWKGLRARGSGADPRAPAQPRIGAWNVLRLVDALAPLADEPAARFRWLVRRPPQSRSSLPGRPHRTAGCRAVDARAHVVMLVNPISGENIHNSYAGQSNIRGTGSRRRTGMRSTRTGGAASLSASGCGAPRARWQRGARSSCGVRRQPTS